MRSIEEQADHMLRKMTVDMSIDLWQTKECAKNAVDEIIDVLVELSNGEFTFIHEVEYWKKVKQEIEKR